MNTAGNEIEMIRRQVAKVVAKLKEMEGKAKE